MMMLSMTAGRGRMAAVNTGMVVRVLVLLACSATLTAHLCAQDLFAPSRQVSFTLKFTLQPRVPLAWTELTVKLPETCAPRQQITALRFFPAESATVVTRNGGAYAVFHLNHPRASEVVTISGDATIYRMDLSTVMHKTPPSPQPDAAALASYLVSEKDIEVTAKTMQATAQTISGKSNLEIVRNIMAYVINNVTYVYRNAEPGALWTLILHEGDCKGFSELFVALCRAKGIPARRCRGFMGEPQARFYTMFHAWAEAYIAPYGWVAFDPMSVQKDTSQYLKMPNDYVTQTNIMADPVLHGNTYPFLCVSETIGGQKNDRITKVTGEFMCH